MRVIRNVYDSFMKLWKPNNIYETYKPFSFFLRIQLFTNFSIKNNLVVVTKWDVLQLCIALFLDIEMIILSFYVELEALDNDIFRYGTKLSAFSQSFSSFVIHIICFISRIDLHNVHVKSDEVRAQVNY